MRKSNHTFIHFTPLVVGLRSGKDFLGGFYSKIAKRLTIIQVGGVITCNLNMKLHDY